MDTNHEWARSPGERWHCRHCPATTWTPMPGECPGREPVMPVSEVRSLLEGLRDRIHADAANLDRRSSSTTSANHHKAEQARKDARRLDDALTTLPGSDR